MSVPSSAGVLALRVVWIMGCVARALASRATQPLDDAVSMIQRTRLLSGDLKPVLDPLACVDSNGAARDAQGRDCDFCSGRRQTQGSPDAFCCAINLIDDDDFTASLMCCDCRVKEKVTTTPRPTPSPTEACVDLDGNATDSQGYTCATLDTIRRFSPPGCGLFDDDDFTGNILCCFCGGGGPTAAPTPGPTAPAGEPPSPAPTQACVDLDGGATDSQGNTCATLHTIKRVSSPGCGLYDDGDFTGNILCCICGGGGPTAAPTPAPTAPAGEPSTPGPTQACVDLDGGATDSQGQTCATLDTIRRFSPPGCGLFDDDDFTGNILCCFCGGGGPTAAPTPAPTQETSATGDPHVTNVDGARFNLLRAGVHELLRLPRWTNGSRGSAEPEPLLSVSAAVERADEGCHESYLKQVDVTGGWLHSCGPLRFRVSGGTLDDARAISISVNGSLVGKEALGHDDRVRPFLATESRASHVNPASGTKQKVPMFTVKLSFAAATLRIDWIHRAVPSGPPVNHLNFQAHGLRKFLEGAGMDIGGILGRDDHSYAASLPEDCRPAGADLRVSSRASGEEGSLQMITAAL